MMEKNRENAIVKWGIYVGVRRHYSIMRYILGLFRDNGRENGNYYLGFRV